MKQPNFNGVLYDIDYSVVTRLSYVESYSTALSVHSIFLKSVGETIVSSKLIRQRLYHMWLMDEVQK
jgi:hypothetical protein